MMIVVASTLSWVIFTLALGPAALKLRRVHNSAAIHFWLCSAKEIQRVHFLHIVWWRFHHLMHNVTEPLHSPICFLFLLSIVFA